MVFFFFFCSSLFLLCVVVHDLRARLFGGGTVELENWS